ncbi:hypothetical protein KSF78_0000266 [Schistosoma japonicum]|nr:hypothetical protein KSF78_0000266 [Schistosoma japonicum]
MYIVILLFPSENAKVVKKKPKCNSQKQLRTCADMQRTEYDGPVRDNELNMFAIEEFECENNLLLLTLKQYEIFV